MLKCAGTKLEGSVHEHNNSSALTATKMFVSHKSTSDKSVWDESYPKRSYEYKRVGICPKSQWREIEEESIFKRYIQITIEYEQVSALIASLFKFNETSRNQVRQRALCSQSRWIYAAALIFQSIPEHRKWSKTSKNLGACTYRRRSEYGRWRALCNLSTRIQFFFLSFINQP